MRILHTSDWHLGKRLESYSRFGEQEAVLNEICDIAEEQDVDAVLIAGDLYDNYNPPTEAVDLFYKVVKRLSADGQRAVIAIAGNHDSPSKIESPDPLARECGIVLSGFPHSYVKPFHLSSGMELTRSEQGFIEMKLPRVDFPLRLLLTPYANEYRLKTYLGIDDPEQELRAVLRNQWVKLAEKYCDQKGVNILMSHLYFMQRDGDRPAEPEAEKPILHMGGAQEIYTSDIPKEIQYTALGHLHRSQTVLGGSATVAYCGSPLAYSFSEAGQQKYVHLIDAEPRKEIQLDKIPLKNGKPLLRCRFTDTMEAVKWLQDHPDALVELTMVKDKYLTSRERKSLAQAHSGIVNIIPEISDDSLLGGPSSHSINLNDDIDSLFRQYFAVEYGQEPNEQIMELFKEVKAENPEE